MSATAPAMIDRRNQLRLTATPKASRIIQRKVPATRSSSPTTRDARSRVGRAVNCLTAWTTVHPVNQCAHTARVLCLSDYRSRPLPSRPRSRDRASPARPPRVDPGEGGSRCGDCSPGVGRPLSIKSVTSGGNLARSRASATSRSLRSRSAARRSRSSRSPASRSCRSRSAVVAASCRSRSTVSAASRAARTFSTYSRTSRSSAASRARPPPGASCSSRRRSSLVFGSGRRIRSVV